jgi:hypothetical protein
MGDNNVVEQDNRELVGSAASDFDFIIGDWDIKHRRLKSILNGCDEWVEFSGISSATQMLAGNGNLEEHTLESPDATFSAMAIRSFNEQSKKWAIWWLDGRAPDVIDKPVIGQFVAGKGLFYAEEEYKGTPVTLRFTWILENPAAPVWQQAFSKDGGDSWETNWIMELSPRN